MSFMSGIASAFGSIGGILNGLTGVTESQDRTYSQQKKSMQAQNEYNTAMWNMQNQYNSPTAQLARMREAGIDINPTSYALGTGNLSNTATFVGSENGFSGSGSPAGNPISMALSVANGIAEYKLRDANADFIDTQNQNLRNYITGKGRSTYDPVVQKNTSYLFDKVSEIGKRIGTAYGNYAGSIGSFLSNIYSPTQRRNRRVVQDFIKKEKYRSLEKDLK